MRLFATLMEQMPEVYYRRYESRRPVICMDKQPKQLIDQVRLPVPVPVQLPLLVLLLLLLLLTRLLPWVPVDDATSLVPNSDKEASAV